METKKVLILGIDGYLGWALALRLGKKGHEVYGIDNLITRTQVMEVGGDSAFPLPSVEERRNIFKRYIGPIDFVINDITKPNVLRDYINKVKPDVIVHFAEQRSAPYSMIDEDHAIYTMHNNIEGTIRLIYAVKDHPEIHILKMGTMGEYGTPNYDIPESPYVKFEYNGKSDMVPVPKFAGSWYHWTKVHDSHNLLFANKVWGITVTDINQGPVYGTRTSDMMDGENVIEGLRTRIDVDEAWGTVINRNAVRAVLGLPLLVYGKGGQTRGFISLEDSVNALEILINNPPKEGEFRVVNQFMELYSVEKIAMLIADATEKLLGYRPKIHYVRNPRIEKEEHYYNPERKILPSLGYEQKRFLKDEIYSILTDLYQYRDRLKNFSEWTNVKTDWRNGRNDKNRFDLIKEL
ncbi:NAD-dependent dehydratase [Acidianus hospitalis]|uniref:NAD-dependent dehydratase n=1 Tax=Acidianus hospitalis TaxID=563177 RepID=A0A2T9X314_9CREN|nr:NAD-dependent dehydratase [Acidianus hospitalis]